MQEIGMEKIRRYAKANLFWVFNLETGDEAWIAAVSPEDALRKAAGKPEDEAIRFAHGSVSVACGPLATYTRQFLDDETMV